MLSVYTDSLFQSDFPAREWAFLQGRVELHSRLNRRRERMKGQKFSFIFLSPHFYHHSQSCGWLMLNSWTCAIVQTVENKKKQREASQPRVRITISRVNLQLSKCHRLARLQRFMRAIFTFTMLCDISKSFLHFHFDIHVLLIPLHRLCLFNESAIAFITRNFSEFLDIKQTVGRSVSLLMKWIHNLWASPSLSLSHIEKRFKLIEVFDSMRMRNLPFSP